MAVDDFYAAHPEYSTRLALHIRDSSGDAFGAAAAAIDLLKNVQAKTIVGPQTSLESRFVMNLGDRAHVPIMSFSAISPSLSTKESPYFIHTSLIDSLQAKVITSIIQEFKWNEVVPVFEDSEHGNGIVPYLLDAFQEINVRVPYRSTIPPTATKDEILTELKKLKNMQTRVFVAHLTCNLGLQLLLLAKEEGMLEEGYVWIATYALTDIINLMGSSASAVMQGIVGIKPFVKTTRKLVDFKQGWRKRFHQENPHTHITEPTFFGLWAYDSIWSIALAVERMRRTKLTFQELNTKNSSTDLASIGFFSSGAELLQSILMTTFDGLAGKFNLVNNQLEFPTFEIVNVVGPRQRRVGFWSPLHGISRWRNSSGKLDIIQWPGATKVVPKGWEWPTKGKKLRIGVSVQPRFNKFLHAEWDARFNNLTVEGYSIDIFKAVMRELPYASYEFVLYGDRNGSSNGTYNDLLYQIYLQNFDGVVGDVTILANRSLYADFTLPYTDSGVSMLVPLKNKNKKSSWTFLVLLDTNLWLAIGAFFIFTGFVVWLLEHKINGEFQGSPKDQLATVLFFTLSSLVFAHREKLLSNLSRIVMIAWVFVVFVLQSIYIAKLSSMLTIEQLQPTVRGLDDLIKQGYYVGYMNDSFMPTLLKRWEFNESKLIAFNSPQDYHEALSNGTLAVFLDETPYLKIFLNEHCGKYTMVGPIYKTAGFGFAFSKGSPLVREVSKGILKLQESNEMLKIDEKLYGSKMCHASEEDITSPIPIRLTFHSFWGLFLSTGVASIAALALHLVSFLFKHRQPTLDDQMDTPTVSNTTPAISVPKAPQAQQLFPELSILNLSMKQKTFDIKFRQVVCLSRKMDGEVVRLVWIIIALEAK
ncbi:hypothetical protein HPP92_017155 [Vanilla planifolia]|uniref:Glutamate receptor n=1 Tax=Vanilla planifolia TaxID=51239 RepID=A0A835URY7_VANPL|nr:hypothetical protein HPP92_017155 [Vanilla planifolia]